jgi:hypothetical protein
MFQMAELGGRFYRGEVFFLFGFEISRGARSGKREHRKNEATSRIKQQCPRNDLILYMNK